MTQNVSTPFVMIIEDDRDIGAYYRHVMDMAGYRTEIIVNGKVALEHLYNSAPDIVLLDLSLPGVSGVEVLKILKSDERLKGTRVVVITGYSQIAASLPVEPDLIMMKPVGPEQLTGLTGRLFQDDKTLEKRPFGKNPWDKATGLYNRPFFINRLSGALRITRKNKGNLFGVLLISPQGDKSLRSSMDREKREAILQEVANTLKGSMRPTDTLARFDRDHFYILVENIPGEEILSMIAGRIRAALDSHPAGGIRFGIGAVLCDSGYDDFEHILRDVKTAHRLAAAETADLRVFSRAAIQQADIQATDISSAGRG